MLFRQNINALFYDLIGNIGAVCTSASRANVVDEGDLLEITRVGKGDADFPTRVVFVVDFYG